MNETNTCYSCMNKLIDYHREKKKSLDQAKLDKLFKGWSDLVN
jgi:hypothetical protein